MGLMSRSVAIMCYGTQADRLRLAALAKLKKQSSSEFMLTIIREQYRDVYGDAPPPEIADVQRVKA